MSEKIIDIVHKLLAKAESTEFPEEAEALSAKAAALMEKHTIDSSMLRDSDPGEIGGFEIDVTGAYLISMRKFAVEVGDALGFSVLIHKRGTRTTIGWYGFNEELKVAEIVWASLRLQQERFNRKHMETWTPPNPLDDRADRFYEKRSFMIGFAQGVAPKIRAARARARNEYNDQAGVALVLADRSKEVERWMHEKFRIGQGRAGRATRNSASGLAGGRAAGQRADIGQGRVGGNRGAVRG